MTADDRPRILCLDDEPNVLEGLARTLRNQFRVESTLEGSSALELLQASGPFAIVMSDLRMPKMNGVSFLTQVRRIAPESVRVLLTGQADMESAIAAVNDGNIFRFLTKPCPADVLLRSLAACSEQYRLITSERVLLEQTLRGCIKTLTEILSLASPVAFGRATRVRQAVVQLMAHFKIEEQWPVEVAAMLSQTGYVILPHATLEKLYRGDPLGNAEREMVDRVPGVTEQLLSNIPRLEQVQEILHSKAKPFHGGTKHDAAQSVAIPWGARALKIALDYDILESEKASGHHPFDVMRGRTGWYDAVILEAFAQLRGSDKQEVRMLELTLREIAVGMVFGEDVKTSKGLLLIARGQEVTASLLERSRNFSPDLAIREPIRMIVRELAAVPA